MQVIDRDDLGLLSLTSRASERVKKIKIKALMLLNGHIATTQKRRLREREGGRDTVTVMCLQNML